MFQRFAPMLRTPSLQRCKAIGARALAATLLPEPPALKGSQRRRAAASPKSLRVSTGGIQLNSATNREGRRCRAQRRRVYIAKQG